MSSLNLSKWDLHKHKVKSATKISIVILAVLASLLQINIKGEKTIMQVFHAGSLTGPFSKYATFWTLLNPDQIIDNEGYGSATAIRQVTELGRQADLVGSADYSLIEKMMMEKQIPGTNINFSSWYIIFARNKMVLAFDPRNNPPFLYNLLDHVNNWWEILALPEVTFGRADPWQDPCGYRTLMVWALADRYYNLTKDENPQLINLTLFRKDPMMGYSGPGTTLVKAKEIDLVASLKAGEIDYLFIYESIAIQHHLSYFEFDDHCDLSNFSLEEFYNKVKVSRASPLVPGEGSPPKKAKTIQYGLTIPTLAPHPIQAIIYLQFILMNPQFIEGMGLKPYSPLYASDTTKVPAPLKSLCTDYPLA
ncbi:MAG: substrate-binding domain-containing protein [Candidatus Helarchaeota archaeon]|nr:substrate-binding domain-containing protein [Candidatus Helarchaeota archaeon]